MKIKDIINYGIKNLNEKNIDDSVIKSKGILKYILKQNNSYITCNLEKNLDDNIVNEYMKYIDELIQGKPLQYITHYQEFMKLDFYVDENVLIPQPDTEILVEEVLNKIKEIKQQKRKNSGCIKILDLCTGSGAIAISIKKYEQDVEMYASDISKKALDIAKQNAIENDVNIEFIQSDMFNNLKSDTKFKNKFDIIVSNPPYIESSEISKLPIEVINEPHIALDGRIRWIRFL